MTDTTGERTGPPTPDIVIITGMSGAGRSTAAKSLEDLGWFVVDNLPPALLPTMLDLADRASLAGIAAIVDVRSRAFSTDNIAHGNDPSAPPCAAAITRSASMAPAIGARTMGNSVLKSSRSRRSGHIVCSFGELGDWHWHLCRG